MKNSKKNSKTKRKRVRTDHGHLHALCAKLGLPMSVTESDHHQPIFGGGNRPLERETERKRERERETKKRLRMRSKVSTPPFHWRE